MKQFVPYNFVSLTKYISGNSRSERRIRPKTDLFRLSDPRNAPRKQIYRQPRRRDSAPGPLRPAALREPHVPRHDPEFAQAKTVQNIQ